jgi:hypothetical protein
VAQLIGGGCSFEMLIAICRDVCTLIVAVGFPLRPVVQMIFRTYFISSSIHGASLFGNSYAGAYSRNMPYHVRS